MLRATFAALASSSRLTGYSPYKPRPKRLHRSATDGHFVNSNYARSAARRRDDPTPVISANHVCLFRCSHCHRVKHVHISEKGHFHTCCEGQPMKDTRMTLKTAQAKQQQLQKLARVYDFAEMKPRYGMTRPASKARSKMPKK